MPTSCEDLWRMGHTLNGIYSVRGAKQMETVFCQFDKRPNEQGYQTLIGYVDVKSLPTYFNVHRLNSFNSTGVAIPFEVESVNVGNAMNLTTGIFTAPRGGIYFFSFNGLAFSAATETWLFLRVGLFLNGKKISETWERERDITGEHYSPVTIQSTLKLKANDRIWLQIAEMRPTTTLYDDTDGYTRFTGFVLDEEFAVPN
ncbi:complement C1q and tumor necrosis factor-related protein 9B-like [Daphnia carinata]|uniref:complement C1q and tumor necrosis factor-related protein 9B-like n=1 Tax=Daphnia carinata TaxID=120202 RepID=UPI0028683E7F|nr:complement C1q and tumor necrosis factor-related protein 9B-like [Daphnia carinata]